MLTKLGNIISENYERGKYTSWRSNHGPTENVRAHIMKAINEEDLLYISGTGKLLGQNKRDR